MGAVVDGGAPIFIRNEDVILAAGIDETEFKAVCGRELVEIEQRKRVYLGNRERLNIAGCTVILVDDGIATGATTRAALSAIRARHPKKLVLAVPVAPADTLRQLRDEVDDLVCLEQHEAFRAIGSYYRDFIQLNDPDVITLLSQFPPATRAEAPVGEVR